VRRPDLQLGPRLRAYGNVLRARLPRPDYPPPRPRATHFLITWRCNLRCTACDAWERDNEGELTAEQWRTVFAQLRSLDIVKIIGGEPFLRTDLEQVVRVIREEVDPFVIQLVTNGTATDRIVQLAEREGWPGLHLRLSLNGLEETHDAARGKPGTFKQVMQTMEALSEVRRRVPFSLAVNFTLTDDSLADMDPLIQRCKALGVDVVAGFRVKPFLRHCNLSREKVELLGTGEPAKLLDRLEQGGYGARQSYNPLERLALAAINKLVYRKHVSGGEALRFRCRELRDLMYLNPYGDLITCGLRQEPVGNIYREGFETVWYSPKADAAREVVDSCPGCMQGAVEIMSKVYGG